MTTPYSMNGMGFAMEVVDWVVVFDNGDIIEAGAPEKIFTDLENERTRTFLRRVLKR